MLIETSAGEVIDKITILKIKMNRIKDLKKLKYVENELKVLENAISDECLKVKKQIPVELYERLQCVNEEIWDTEDVLRLKERDGNYDADFIKCAVLDSELNDKRFLIKAEINVWFGEAVREQKSYEHLEYEVK